jgi:hypothetical protein
VLLGPRLATELVVGLGGLGPSANELARGDAVGTERGDVEGGEPAAVGFHGRADTGGAALDLGLVFERGLFLDVQEDAAGQLDVGFPGAGAQLILGQPVLKRAAV